MSKKEVSRILEYGTYIIITLCIILETLFSTYGELIIMIVGALVVIYCANKNEEWASKIDRNVNLAFVIGIVFGLFGLLAYWILYKLQINNPTPESRANKMVVSLFLAIVILIGGIGFSINLVDEIHKIAEIGDESYISHEYKTATPTSIPFFPTTKQVSSFEEYGFSFDYPSNMIILKEGYFSDEANDNSGLVFVENERQTKFLTIRWYSTTQPFLEDNLQQGIDFLEEDSEVSDLSMCRVIEKNISENRIIYRTLSYRVEGIKFHSIMSFWYDNDSQRMFYIGIDTYDEKETDKLFNDVVDSFHCKPIQISHELTNLEEQYNSILISLKAFEEKWAPYTKEGWVDNPNNPTGRRPYIRGTVFTGTNAQYEEYLIDYDIYEKNIEKINLLQKDIDKYYIEKD